MIIIHLTYYWKRNQFIFAKSCAVVNILSACLDYVCINNYNFIKYDCLIIYNKVAIKTSVLGRHVYINTKFSLLNQKHYFKNSNYYSSNDPKTFLSDIDRYPLVYMNIIYLHIYIFLYINLNSYLLCIRQI